ncbi:hypothetical protein CYMTET_40185 [Cymbomonas tetramitiformis]|uniref:Xylose isomerase-like TIM barrel domain-containing protein n=1 Tax=Cymbomonas tetramitiformis TaxID=36881 RepID=A0AAE0F3H6_9CHLO|nr:hypothetical protein CYMTET_40185 [Cymbomonas tetramitiformis]
MRPIFSTRKTGIQRVASKIQARAERRPLQVSNGRVATASNAPALKLAKPLWGVPANKHDWDELFSEYAEYRKYDAIEVPQMVWRENPNLFSDLLQKHGLHVICQIHTTGGDLDSKGNHLDITSNKPADHVASLKTLVAEAKALNPLMINVHSGHASWSVTTACDYFKAALDIEADAGVPLVHETHRQSLLGFPGSASQILQRTDMQELKISLDVSQWDLACRQERFYSEDKPWYEPMWMLDAPSELFKTAAEHTFFMRARVDWDQGPKVVDFEDKYEYTDEYNPVMLAHLHWWAHIWLEQARRGVSEFWVTTMDDFWLECGIVDDYYETFDE